MVWSLRRRAYRVPISSWQWLPPLVRAGNFSCGQNCPFNVTFWQCGRYLRRASTQAFRRGLMHYLMRGLQDSGFRASLARSLGDTTTGELQSAVICFTNRHTAVGSLQDELYHYTSVISGKGSGVVGRVQRWCSSACRSFSCLYALQLSGTQPNGGL